MSLVVQVIMLFGKSVRQRGSEYAAAGRVHVVNSEDSWASFEVEGSDFEPYTVLLDWENGLRNGMECNCPHYDRGNFCKHLWAAILFADRLGLANNSRGSKKRGSHAVKTPSWKSQLGRAVRPSHSNHLSRSATLANLRPRQLLFCLEPQIASHALIVLLYQQEKRDDGSWGEATPFQMDDPNFASVAGPDDLRLLGLLKANLDLTEMEDLDEDWHEFDSPAEIELKPELYEFVLPMLANTHRFFYLPRYGSWEEARPIGWDANTAWSFQLSAQCVDSKKAWEITGKLTTGRQVRPLSDCVRYYPTGLILIDDQLARFDLPADRRWLELLSRQGSLLVPYQDQAALIEELWHHGSPGKILGDERLNLTSVEGHPRGKLVVQARPGDTKRRYRKGSDPVLFADVSFLYQQHEAALDSTQRIWPDAESLQVIRANETEEARLLDRLHQLGMNSLRTTYLGSTSPGRHVFPAGSFDQITAQLIEEDWEVHAEGVPVRKSSGLSLNVRSKVDWFELEGEANFDGQVVSLPDLLKSLKNGERYIRLGDGTQGMLPEQWLETLGVVTGFAQRSEEDSLRFQSSQALLLDSMLSAAGQAASLKVDRKFYAIRKKLQSFDGIKPAKPPQSFQGNLRKYQQEGLGWLNFLEKFSFGGCLADDMGLGKTVQVLALLAARKRRSPKSEEKRPSLVVAPNSVVHNWKLEAERFSPRLNVAIYAGTDRKKKHPELDPFDLVLTTYGTMRKDIERLSQIGWDYAILDEAQAIKNNASQTAKASRLLNARHRLALSGTPIENHMGELWSLMEFLNPGLLGTSSNFKNLTGKGSEIDQQQVDVLRQGLAPFLLRRTKAQVLPQLPQKTEQRLYCDLPPSQQKQYDQLRDHYRASLNQKIARSGMAKTKIHVLEALLRLRQAACHPGLIDPAHSGKPSAKLKLLLEQLDEVVSEGHKALVFSQFTKMLAIVKQRLEDVKISYEYLDGKTKDRQSRVDRFQNDADCRVFLISLKAGGTGLNLTAADYVYLLDPWWNPAVESQAIDRAHRIGQTNPVFAYRLIAKNTVEEKILELQSQKSKLAEAIISADSSLLKNLSAEDLQAILS
ncbi:DEAD/DEAH box helicase [Bremerella alba]|uniref:RNA polymerase-associated protein RapA n=1 Tax=Bremerella alba TaxID=980252 RepID=A0A7V9A5X6_9BACT|nr:DEAD/DEAH box helicase [Bremerella alba]MBA2113810.1 RNA polymerase-associated protein RapA [Bremerella alba]